MNLSVSQNFITDKQLVADLIKKARITQDDVVYDVGSGKGILAVELAKNAKTVHAFELDSTLASALKLATAGFPNIQLHLEDFLKYTLPENGDYKVFSNIPFSITSDIINKLVFAKNPPTDAFLFVQKEAASRYLGKGEGTLLSLLLLPFFEMKVVHHFDRADFDPKPSVDVVLLQIQRRTSPLVDMQHAQEYRSFVAYALWQQKPTLKLRLTKVFTSNQFYRLSKDLKFAADIEAADLSLAQWIGLFNYYLVGVETFKKNVVAEVGQRYFVQKLKLSGPSRTKIRLG